MCIFVLIYVTIRTNNKIIDIKERKMEKTLKRKNPVISLHKTIIHILNKEQQNLTLTDYEIPCTLEIDKMFTKLIKSVQRNESLRKATFNQFSKSKIKTKL